MGDSTQANFVARQTQKEVSRKKLQVILFEIYSQYHRCFFPFADITFREETVRLLFAALLYSTFTPSSSSFFAFSALVGLLFRLFSFSVEASSSAAGGTNHTRIVQIVTKIPS